jgi:hypothetical protein
VVDAALRRRYERGAWRRVHRALLGDLVVGWKCHDLSQNARRKPTRRATLPSVPIHTPTSPATAPIAIPSISVIPPPRAARKALVR